MKPTIPLLLVAASLMACAPAPRPDEAEALGPPIPFATDASGIQLLDRPQRIDFGRTQHSTVPAMRKVLAAREVAVGPCAEGGQFVVWADGTQLVFVNGAFRGWERVSATEGSTRAGAPCGKL